MNVPTPPPFRMAQAPLAQAIVQVNFPIVPLLQTLEGAAAVQQLLGGRYPYLAQNVVQQMSLMVGPAGPAAPLASQAVVHELTADDGWSLTLTLSSASLSVGPTYAGINDFVGRFAEVCIALRAVANVARCDRLGVRYLDLVQLNEDAEHWEEWFRPEIVGVAATKLSRPTLVSSLTETRLRSQPAGPFDDVRLPIEGVLRHGVVPPGSMLVGVPPRAVEEPVFVFDMDAFVAGTQVFDPAGLAEQLRALHAEIEKVFHWAVTAQGRERFGYEAIAGGDE